MASIYRPTAGRAREPNMVVDGGEYAPVRSINSGYRPQESSSIKLISTRRSTQGRPLQSKAHLFRRWSPLCLLFLDHIDAKTQLTVASHPTTVGQVKSFHIDTTPEADQPQSRPSQVQSPRPIARRTHAKVCRHESSSKQLTHGTDMDANTRRS